MTTRKQDAAIAAAAYSYLVARERLAGATGPELAVYAVELDDALHTLTNAAGFAAEGCDCDDCAQIRSADERERWTGRLVIDTAEL